MPGAKLFAVAGCTACHTYLGTGSSNLGAPDLTAIGTRNLGDRLPDPPPEVPVVRRSRARRCRSSRRSATKRLRQLAIFLEASKGKHGKRRPAAIPGNARLPRDHRRLRRALRGPAARGARGGRLRDRRLRVERRDRGARDRALRQRAALARRDARAPARARAARDRSTTRTTGGRRTRPARRRSTRT